MKAAVLPAAARDPVPVPALPRTRYHHRVCGMVNELPPYMAESFRRRPHFYPSLWCSGCRAYVPVEQCAWAEDGAAM
jgi:hypothetical protein